ncbi:GIN domain-containing protein [Flammeovirga pectinis]|nr:DUF2807 domain-containing protein [Flammeovirga pectinis]
MKIFIYSLLLLVTIFSCNKETVETNGSSIPLQTFKGIKAGSLRCNVTVEYGDQQQVLIDADQDILNALSLDITDDASAVWEIKLAENVANDFYNNPLEINIKTPDFQSCDISGDVTVKLVDLLSSTGDLDLDIEGNSSLEAEKITRYTNEIEISVKNSGSVVFDEWTVIKDLDIEASGATTLELKGVAKEYDAEVTESGNVSSEELVTENADINASGASHIKVNCTKVLNATASGSGVIEYVQNLTVTVNEDVSGGASVRPISN